jgi:hypothetical protein
MRSGVAGGRWVVALIASILMLLVGPAASAIGDAKVRLVHTVPGAEDVQVEATADGITQRIGRGVGFGEVGGYEDVPSGAVKFDLLDADGRPVTGAREELKNRAHYSVVAMRNKPLMVLRDGRAEGGTSRLRVVQAAPELGMVDVMAGDEAVADGIAYGDTSAYTGLGPGAYSLRVANPADGSTIASRGAVTLTAGSASTAFVVGTAGEPVGVVVAGDRSAAPRGAPATGLGGLADGDSHLPLALLAGFLAALAGAAAYMALTARSRRGGL